MLPFTPGAVDQDRAQRDPVEPDLGQGPLGLELGAAIGVGRRRRHRPPPTMPGALGPIWARIEDRNTKRRTRARAAASREPARRLGVERPVIVLRGARHGVGEARPSAPPRRRRAGAAAMLIGRVRSPTTALAAPSGSADRPPQQHADPVAPRGEVAQEVAADEAGGPGERDESGHGWAAPSAGAGAGARAKRRSRAATRANPAASAASVTGQDGQSKVAAASAASARLRPNTRPTTPGTVRPLSVARW